ncbi:MAG: hypothetical protein JO128_07005 [Alphaproteobacteria bacterium]|nr:hypothetical protein [Alphaproteobacteria bacterium]
MSRSIGYTKFDRGLSDQLKKMLERAASVDVSDTYSKLKERLGREESSGTFEPPSARPSGLPSKK